MPLTEFSSPPAPCFLVRKWSVLRGTYGRTLSLSPMGLSTWTTAADAITDSAWNSLSSVSSLFGSGLENALPALTNQWEWAQLLAVHSKPDSLWIRLELPPLCGIGPNRSLHIEATNEHDKNAILRTIHREVNAPRAMTDALEAPQTAAQIEVPSFKGAAEIGVKLDTPSDATPGQTGPPEMFTYEMAAEVVAQAIHRAVEAVLLDTEHASAKLPIAPVEAPATAPESLRQSLTRSRVAALEEAAQEPVHKLAVPRRPLPLSRLQEADLLMRGENTNMRNSLNAFPELALGKESVDGWETIRARDGGQKTVPHTWMELQERMRVERQHQRGAEAMARALLRRPSFDAPNFLIPRDSRSTTRPASLFGSTSESHDGSKASSMPNTVEKKAPSALDASLKAPPSLPVHLLQDS